MAKKAGIRAKILELLRGTRGQYGCHTADPTLQIKLQEKRSDQCDGARQKRPAKAE